MAGCRLNKNSDGVLVLDGCVCVCVRARVCVRVRVCVFILLFAGSVSCDHYFIPVRNNVVQESVIVVNCCADAVCSTDPKTPTRTHARTHVCPGTCARA